MSASSRANDKRIRDQQKLETKQIAGLITLLKLFENITLIPQVDVELSVCPHDGCLLFPSDPNCPMCRFNLMERSRHGRPQEASTIRFD